MEYSFVFMMMVFIMVAPFGLAIVLSFVARQSATLRRALQGYPHTGRAVVDFFGDDASGPRPSNAFAS